LEKHNLKLQAKYDAMAEQECRWQEEQLTDAEIVLVAYGTTSRIARSAMRKCREKGIKVGLLRPITLWPFPTAALQKTVETADFYLCVEMSMGQMVDDVRLAVDGARPVDFYGRSGGMVPTVAELVARIEELAGISNSEGAGFEKKVENFARQVEQAADALGAKLNDLGRKLDEKLQSPEFAEKTEQLKEKANLVAEKAKTGFMKGMDQLRGAIGNALDTVKKDLADIEAQQAAEKGDNANQSGEAAADSQQDQGGDQ
jgi:hypothetical protein